MAFQFTQTGQEIQDILDLAQLQIAAPYDSASSYTAGDYCTKDDGFYVCTASTSGTWDGSKWSAVTVGDVLETAIANISSLNATLTNTNTALTTVQGKVSVLEQNGLGALKFTRAAWTKSISFPASTFALILANNATLIGVWYPSGNIAPITLTGQALSNFTYSHTNGTTTFTAQSNTAWAVLSA